MDTSLQLSLEKELQLYKDSPELRRLWDIFEGSISAEAITKEREENKTLYYGHEEDIKKVLIRRLLLENNIWDGIRKSYTQITTERILLFFRKEVFMWSTTGKDYVDREKNITPLLRLPETYLLDLYTENIADIEEGSRVIDALLTTMEEEFEPWKIVRTCAYFYSHKPAFGKQPAIYKNCLAYIAELLVYIRKNIPNEAFFQTAGVHARQKHDEFEKNSGDEAYRAFVNFSDKTVSQIQHDIEETLAQYIKTLLLFSQVQNKSEKDEVLHELNTFLFPVGYSVENMGYKISPIYKGVFDRIRFKKSGWELIKV